MHLLTTPLLAIVAAMLLVFTQSACSDSSDGAATPTSTSASAPSEAAQPAASPPVERPVEPPVAKAAAAEPAQHAQHRTGERPLPSFDGRTLDGRRVAISEYIGKRLVLFLFNPEAKDVDIVGRAIADIAKQRGANNFEVIGVAMASNVTRARAFLADTGLDITVFDDSSAAISRRLGIRTPVALYGVDKDGYYTFGIGAFATDVPKAEAVIAADLRDRLRLPDADAVNTGTLIPRKEAPDFEAVKMDGSGRFKLADHEGKPVVVVFFLHTCPHCHKALAFLKIELAKYPEETRPVLAGISLRSNTTSIRQMMQSEGIDYFPVLLDDDRSARTAYDVFGGVPDISLIDSSGNIVHQVRGWDEQRDPALMRMYLARIAGATPPMLLNPKGYTGSDVCGICHETELATWRFTKHATAFDTLVTHGEDHNGECVSCHVVGYGEDGGYSLANRVAPAYLEDVGCESCHGRGGPHLSPNFVAGGDYNSVCATCHNPTHSLGFEYASFHPKISHSRLASITDGERAALVASFDRPREVLPTNAPYVGSEACASCHVAEYETWAASGHAHAVATLEAKDKGSDTDCLVCHTTAAGRDGGFVLADAASAQTDLARVGCESCHGPGGAHIPEGARKLGSIVSLGDKCDSCVILQICGSCHDPENDPGFEFQVEARIEAQRHGTIEAGTGKPLGAQAGTHATPADLAHAFAVLEAGSLSGDHAH